ncbi:nucleotide sugar dehydrogenase [Flagellimonas okinawensis]|uniref:UDP-glucose 6-dehydrogenase n=1 Tax=Flagellimonas okinawensis TaxID=3031324 RepID=A0ABT5XLV7_9FLAO|nr:UDP-glucose/GDP-mannose dehydrogenase family protein [[Muricauda] okinawensis]MDF0706870.1 UDP-glucose/GDP-mannose dehydrogenase family protein [[Muricauda] okinawensis]
MNISVFGLGYVGVVSCACFSREGHRVIGVDIEETKVNLINSGKATIIEKGLEEQIKDSVEKERLTATKNFEEAVMESDVSFICVGTPSLANGSINLAYIYQVVKQIAESIKGKDSFHTIVIRSTVKPGTLKTCTEIVEDISGKKVNEGFGMVSNPEFLREGSAMKDFVEPPYTIIGTYSEKSESVLKELYGSIEAPIYCIKPEEAELIKYANNNFHALKISFANEIGNICKEHQVDGHKVMDIVCKDTKLNLSPYYMKPGFAFGGSCLPKDVRGLTNIAKKLDLETPLLSSLLVSNRYQIDRGLELILSAGTKKVGFLGFAFKSGTDDLRESPIVEVIETLIGKGFDLKVYDSNVHLSSLMGKNKEYINSHIPHIYKLLKEDINEVIEKSDVLVIGNNSKEFKEILHKIPKDKTIIDLVRIDNELTTSDNYVGICW